MPRRAAHQVMKRIVKNISKLKYENEKSPVSSNFRLITNKYRRTRSHLTFLNRSIGGSFKDPLFIGKLLSWQEIRAWVNREKFSCKAMSNISKLRIKEPL